METDWPKFSLPAASGAIILVPASQVFVPVLWNIYTAPEL
jgi:hypothetical protein